MIDPAQNFTGQSVVVTGKRSFLNARFANPGGHRVLEVMPGGEAIVEASEFNLDGVTTLMAAGIHVHAGGKLTIRGSRLVNAPVQFIKFFGLSLLIEDCTFGAMGLKAGPDAHLEPIFANCGHVRIARTVFDMSDGLGRIAGGITAASVYLESSYGPIIAEMDGVTVRGLAGLKCPAAVQIASRPYPVFLTVNGSTLQKGTSAHIAVTEFGGKVRVIDGGGNMDGVPLDLSRPASNAAAAPLAARKALAFDQIAKLTQGVA